MQTLQALAASFTPKDIWELGGGLSFLGMLMFVVIQIIRNTALTKETMGIMKETMGAMEATMESMRIQMERQNEAIDLARKHNRALTQEMTEASESRRLMAAEMADMARDRERLGREVNELSRRIAVLTSENKGLREQVAHLSAMWERRQLEAGPPQGQVDRRKKG